MQGKVLVRIPSSGQQVWARLAAIGAGASRGFLFVPQPDDEVLVALNQSDPTDAFVIGGLWSNQDRIPQATPPEILSKRTISTGLAGGVGHELTFDDLGQSITITSSTKQQITIDPLKIELKNTAGTLTITMDNTTQTISMKAAAKIELSAPVISIDGKVTLELKGGIVNIKANGPCSIQGLPVKIN
jgi:uncharacterized protein involved in type VI secretion and phage assembly